MTVNFYYRNIDNTKRYIMKIFVPYPYNGMYGSVDENLSRAGQEEKGSE